MKKAIHVGLLIAIAGSIFNLSAQSEEVPARGSIPFADYDKDSDGFISAEEFNTVRGERMAKKAAAGKQMRGAAGAPAFSEFDTNSDGQLSSDELAAEQKVQMEKRQSNRLAKATRMERNRPAFSEFDLNGDGGISVEEFTVHQSQHQRKRTQ